MQTRNVTVTAGTVEYADTGGDGPVVLFLHGLIMDEAAWAPVIDELAPQFRCVVPRLPFGAHRVPLHPDADLSLPGLATMLAEFAAAADLTDITVAGNDWGGAQLMAASCPERIARLVITPSEAFDNIPPGLPGKFAGLAGARAAALKMAARMLRNPLARRLPMTMGWMVKRMPADEVFRRWTEPVLTNPAICHDLVNYVGHANRADMVAYTDRLAEFDKPALVVWASEDRVMPREHGPRLAELMPDARLEWVDDSYVLMALDQPHRLAGLIREFVTEPRRAPSR